MRRPTQAPRTPPRDVRNVEPVSGERVTYFGRIVFSARSRICRAAAIGSPLSTSFAASSRTSFCADRISASMISTARSICSRLSPDPSRRRWRHCPGLCRAGYPAPGNSRWPQPARCYGAREPIVGLATAGAHQRRSSLRLSTLLGWLMPPRSLSRSLVSIDQLERHLVLGPRAEPAGGLLVGRLERHRHEAVGLVPRVQRAGQHLDQLVVAVGRQRVTPGEDPLHGSGEAREPGGQQRAAVVAERPFLSAASASGTSSGSRGPLSRIAPTAAAARPPPG